MGSLICRPLRHEYSFLPSYSGRVLKIDKLGLILIIRVTRRDFQAATPTGTSHLA